LKINFNSFCLSVGGGNRTILELADGLTNRGHEVTVTHMGVSSYYSWYGKPKCEINNLNLNVLLRAFKKYYLKRSGLDYNIKNILSKNIPDCDINVATAYDTVFPTFFSLKGKMFYLVQHYEPWFYQYDIVARAEAKWTYELPFEKLCVSRWLAEKVNGEFLGNGVNLNKFYLMNLERKYDVMVIPRPNVPWKGDYPTAISKLRNKGFKVLVVNNVSERELVHCYNQSKTFLFFSSMKEGFGLPPMEAMACGCVVISTPCTEYFVHEKNCLLLTEADYTRQLLDYLDQLKNKDLSDELRAKGLATAILHDFNDVVTRFEELTK